jgi:ribonuclease HII
MNLPNFSYERKLWRKGIKYVAGADEVGRGCFAGPVVAAVVTFAPIYNSPDCAGRNFPIVSEKGEKILIDDSKRLNSKQREVADKWIRQNALSWGIGVGSVYEINKKGIVAATHSGFRRAVINTNRKLKVSVNHLLIDAFFIPYIAGLPIHKKRHGKGFSCGKNCCQTPIVKGDQKSISVSSASIIAKVYRDKLMKNLSKDKKFKKYLWDKNKGYGTKEHQTAILKYGVTKMHRIMFVNTYLKNSKHEYRNSKQVNRS